MVRRRLLAIMAHPDDESFGIGGTLAKYAGQGVEVHVCTVTDGAAGTSDASSLPADRMSSLASIRRQELACACKVLGVQLHTLDYRDSGMQRISDNQHPRSLFQADMDDVVQELVCIIGQVRPHVVITHDATGGYFHPDHIKVNEAVACAWECIRDAGVGSDLCAESETVWMPARLYHTVIPLSALKWFLRIMKLLRRDPRRFGQNRDIDLTSVGVPDQEIHVRLNVGPYAAIKEQASACHKSQGGGGTLRVAPRFVRRRLFGYEYYTQAQPPDAHPHSDLFEGLGLAE